MNIEKNAAELQKMSERNYNIGSKALKPLRVGDKFEYGILLLKSGLIPEQF